MEAEVTEMRLEEHSERAEGRMSVLSLLSQRSLRWQLVSIIVMNMGQQLSGVNAVSPAPHYVCRHVFIFNPSKLSDNLSIFFIYLFQFQNTFNAISYRDKILRTYLLCIIWLLGHCFPVPALKYIVMQISFLNYLGLIRAVLFRY